MNAVFGNLWGEKLEDRKKKKKNERKMQFPLCGWVEKEEGTKWGGWSFSFETINFIFYFFTRSIWLFLF